MIHKALIDHVQEKLQKLLESDWNQTVVEKVNHFEATTDLSALETLSLTLPEKNPDRIFILFTRMCLYFEAGLLFYSQNGQWKVQAAFQKGQYFPLLPQETQITYNLEPGTLGHVRKVLSEPLKKHLQKMDWCHSDEQIFTLFPHPQFCFLVSTKLPDLWLKNHLEKINQELVYLMADEI